MTIAMIETSGVLYPVRSYIDYAKEGKHTPGRYLFGTVFILATWLILGGLATAFVLLVFVFLRGVSGTELTQLLSHPQDLGYIPYFLVVSVSFIPFILAIWLAVRFIHQRAFRTVVTGKRTVDWGRIWTGFAIWFGLSLISSLIEYLLFPETYRMQFDPASFFPFALLALVLTPIQTSSEELFFRGYLVQAGSLIARSPLFLAFWSGALFTLPHILNPEVSANAPLVLSTYFVLGAFLAFVSIKDGTIELALGAHAANNIYAGLVVTFPDSALSTPALFLTTHFDPLFTLANVVIACLIFYLIAFTVRKPLARPPEEIHLLPE